MHQVVPERGGWRKGGGGGGEEGGGAGGGQDQLIFQPRALQVCVQPLDLAGQSMLSMESSLPGAHDGSNCYPMLQDRELTDQFVQSCHAQ